MPERGLHWPASFPFLLNGIDLGNLALELMTRRTLHPRALNRHCCAGVMCLALLSVVSVAQQERACEPNKTFAHVGSLLRRQDDQAAKVFLRELESCTELS